MIIPRPSQTLCLDVVEFPCAWCRKLAVAAGGCATLAADFGTAAACRYVRSTRHDVPGRPRINTSGASSTALARWRHATPAALPPLRAALPKSPSGHPSIRRQKRAATQGERLDEYFPHFSPLTLSRPLLSRRPRLAPY